MNRRGRLSTVKRRHQLRIIGGRWRGRRLNVPAIDGLRPTTDRIRETVFNWLQSEIVGANCLDLFAGTGALGFEALSRGASSVILLDNNSSSCRLIKQTAREFGAVRALVCCTDAIHWLHNYRGSPFDVVFIDPPFYSGLATRALEALGGGKLLSPRARVYLEQPRDRTEWSLPPSWHVLREARTAGVRYALLTQG